jgi:hypothetical protein
MNDEHRELIPIGGRSLQTLEKINDNISAMGTDIALLKERQKNMETNWEKAEERIFCVIGEMRTILLDKLDRLDHSINIGNGTPSVMARLALLEQIKWKLIGGAAAISGALAIAEFIVHVSSHKG